MMEPTLFRDQCTHSCCGLYSTAVYTSSSHNSNSQHNKQTASIIIGKGVVCVVFSFNLLFFSCSAALVRTATHMDTIKNEKIIIK